MTPVAPTILIADDIPSNLQLMADIIKGQGYEIRAALSGRLALQAIRETPPDLILLDVNMPDISGYEVCRQLKADELLKDIPLIFVSGISNTETIVKAFEVGGADYITKPFQPREVLARIQTHLKARRQQIELQKKNVRLRTLEESRDNLVHMVVHDMRNLLWSSQAYLDEINSKGEAGIPPSVLQCIREASESNRALMDMIETILTVSRMETDMMPLHLAQCNLIDIITDIMQKAEILKKARRLTLTKATTHAVVIGDNALLTRVILNLLNNALKYTDENHGEIRFLVTASEQSVTVGLQDNGTGIPAAYHERIFEKFFIMESALTGQRRSIGLGLPFCKLVVEAHGGRIGIASEENKGSLFWFELPISGPQD